MNRFKKVGAVVLIIIINILVLGIFPLNILLMWKILPYQQNIQWKYSADMEGFSTVDYDNRFSCGYSDCFAFS